MSKIQLTALALVAVGAFIAVPISTAADAPAKVSAHCNTAEYRQFDFWLGDWDTFRINTPGKPSVARNHVTTMLDGCALREVYEKNDGYSGESFTIYDATRKVWHQSWVTNEGELLTAEGTKQGEKIILSGSVHDAKGVQWQRVSWEVQGDGVRETALESRDGGKTWTPLFDILFRPHKS